MSDLGSKWVTEAAPAAGALVLVGLGLPHARARPPALPSPPPAGAAAAWRERGGVPAAAAGGGVFSF